MGLRHVSLLLAIVAPVAWGGADAPASTPSTTRPSTQLAAGLAPPSASPAVRYCKRVAEQGCVDRPIIAALNAFEKECLNGKEHNDGCYEDLRDQVRAGHKKVRELEAEVAHLKMLLREHQSAHRRSRNEIEHANRVFNGEFGGLRKNNRPSSSRGSWYSRA